MILSYTKFSFKKWISCVFCTSPATNDCVVHYYQGNFSTRKSIPYDTCFAQVEPKMIVPYTNFSVKTWIARVFCTGGAKNDCVVH